MVLFYTSSFLIQTEFYLLQMWITCLQLGVNLAWCSFRQKWAKSLIVYMCVCVCLDSEGQSAAIPVASMEFAAICLRNALLLLPEHQQQDVKTENNPKTSSLSGSTESGSENSDACRSDPKQTHSKQFTTTKVFPLWYQHHFQYFITHWSPGGRADSCLAHCVLLSP